MASPYVMCAGIFWSLMGGALLTICQKRWKKVKKKAIDTHETGGRRAYMKNETD